MEEEEEEEDFYEEDKFDKMMDDLIIYCDQCQLPLFTHDDTLQIMKDLLRMT